MTDTSLDALPPGSMIGILGGGQLGKMLIQAASRLGYQTKVWAPPGDNPAFPLATKILEAPYEDPTALKDFVETVDLGTLEFENLPPDVLEKIALHIPMRPSANVLRVTQDRRNEKALFSKMGLRTAQFLTQSETGGLHPSGTGISYPARVKTARLGYDGKGQQKVLTAGEIRSAWERLGKVDCIIEEEINFTHELSVIVARRPNGDMRAYAPILNIHKEGILRESYWPAPNLGYEICEQAQNRAMTIARVLGVEGLITTEFFVTGTKELLVNELAPRPHNSGHVTIDASMTSQFEQHILAICNLPLGSTEPHSDARMVNLIGDEVEQWSELLTDPRAKLHIYGKAEARAGRKMGHVTYLEPLKH